MPHVIVKLWPGKSERQKRRLAEEITRCITETLHYGPESVSLMFEEIAPRDWALQVYQPLIVANKDRLYKTPGYTV